MKYACKCCEHLTHDEPTNGSYNICPVCFWEDDAVQAAYPDSNIGANRVSLNEARKNYKLIGVSEYKWKSFTRVPLPTERV